MYRRLLALALLMLIVQACGNSNGNANTNAASSGTKAAGASQALAVGARPPAAKKRLTAADREKARKAAEAAKLAKAQAAVRAGTYVPPAIQLKTSTGKSPAVVILPDTGTKASALEEARKLSALGLGALVIEGPSAAPTDPDAFDTAVREVELAVANLKKREGIDPRRIGMIGEGVGAHVGAVVAGRTPGSIAGAALADIGGVVVPSSKYAPERWLRRAVGTPILFQRDLAKRAMTKAEMKRLLLASPPATLLEQYKNLGLAAQSSRDRWLKNLLGTG